MPTSTKCVIHMFDLCKGKSARSKGICCRIRWWRLGRCGVVSHDHVVQCWKECEEVIGNGECSEDEEDGFPRDGVNERDGWMDG